VHVDRDRGLVGGGVNAVDVPGWREAADVADVVVAGEEDSMATDIVQIRNFPASPDVEAPVEDEFRVFRSGGPLGCRRTTGEVPGRSQTSRETLPVASRRSTGGDEPPSGVTAGPRRDERGLRRRGRGSGRLRA
jgi:hypothetical protein